MPPPRQAIRPLRPTPSPVLQHTAQRPCNAVADIPPRHPTWHCCVSRDRPKPPSPNWHRWPRYGIRGASKQRVRRLPRLHCCPACMNHPLHPRICIPPIDPLQRPINPLRSLLQQASDTSIATVHRQTHQICTTTWRSPFRPHTANAAGTRASSASFPSSPSERQRRHPRLITSPSCAHAIPALPRAATRSRRARDPLAFRHHDVLKRRSSPSEYFRAAPMLVDPPLRLRAHAHRLGCLANR